MNSISELNKELQTLPPKKIAEVAIRLAKHKKENKELLAYLLFDSENEEAYIDRIKQEIDQHFSEINRSNLYLAKKGLRKIARIINKQIKFTGKPVTELELRIHFCQQIRTSNINYSKSQVLVNLYVNQIKKIETCFAKLHEDLQADYSQAIGELKK